MALKLIEKLFTSIMFTNRMVLRWNTNPCCVPKRCLRNDHERLVFGEQQIIYILSLYIYIYHLLIIYIYIQNIYIYTYIYVYMIISRNDQTIPSPLNWILVGIHYPSKKKLTWNPKMEVRKMFFSFLMDDFQVPAVKFRGSNLSSRDRQGCTPIPTYPYGKSLYKPFIVGIYGL